MSFGVPSLFGNGSWLWYDLWQFRRRSFRLGSCRKTNPSYASVNYWSTRFTFAHSLTPRRWTTPRDSLHQRFPICQWRLLVRIGKSTRWPRLSSTMMSTTTLMPLRTTPRWNIFNASRPTGTSEDLILNLWLTDWSLTLVAIIWRGATLNWSVMIPAKCITRLSWLLFKGSDTSSCLFQPGLSGTIVLLQRFPMSGAVS